MQQFLMAFNAAVLEWLTLRVASGLQMLHALIDTSCTTVHRGTAPRMVAATHSRKTPDAQN